MYIKPVTTALVYETSKAQFPQPAALGTVLQSGEKGKKIYVSLSSNVNSLTTNGSAAGQGVKFNKSLHSSG